MLQLWSRAHGLALRGAHSRRTVVVRVVPAAAARAAAAAAEAAAEAATAVAAFRCRCSECIACMMQRLDTDAWNFGYGYHFRIR